MRKIAIFVVLVAILVVSASYASAADHPLKKGDWMKYKIYVHVKGKTQDTQTEISGTIYVKYKVTEVDEDGFTLEVVDVSGDIDKLRESNFGDWEDLTKGSTLHLYWDEDPEKGNVYADPNQLPKDGKVDLSEEGITATAYYDTKTGILKKLSANGKLEFGGASVEITFKAELVDSSVIKSSSGLCGPALIVGLTPLILAAKRRK
ncbi:CGP-CTERM sorting domain-containing protein [Thermococcus sp. AM4]|uniref:CGP-CTERM sorting domain-containing protein n=1 Tax=Thermococcus sp. (strain AM4) TaxID=246969 RepID=UPI00018707EA|nr:CGP-CTERM sorting domain-containing protein [Thermococcus sp. AM4]